MNNNNLKQPHQPGTILKQRYHLNKVIGEGGIGITYEAQDLETNQLVAIKTLSLERLTDWKVLELFEREARILATLNHPSIPDYIDYFHIDEPENKHFYLVQQLVKGKSLAELVEEDWRPQEAEVKKLATQVLKVLTYLHSLIPPVIHRDIKPQNIIRTKGGKIFLVDFGAVQDTYRHTVAKGSTVVGTFGYMAPEQFRGQATPATDFYGLATTLLFVLTGKSPANLPQQQLKINFRPAVGLSPNFANWLERMLEPAQERRFPDAQAALAVLSGKKRLADYPQKKPKLPKPSLIKLTKTEEQLTIKIAPIWFRSNQALWLIFQTSINTVILFILLFWFKNLLTQTLLEFSQGSDSSNLIIALILILGGVFVSCLWEKQLLTACLNIPFPLHIKVNRETFELRRRIFRTYPSWLRRSLRINKTLKIEINDRIFQPKGIIVFLGNQKYINKKVTLCFGSAMSESDQKWLVEEFKTFLA